MAADMYTMTPGSAVADKLQEILTQRKLEARQALLDKLQQDELRGMTVSLTLISFQPCVRALVLELICLSLIQNMQTGSVVRAQ
jgi:hypothetical protein